jgi:hypothetical protein
MRNILYQDGLNVAIIFTVCVYDRFLGLTLHANCIKVFKIPAMALLDVILCKNGHFIFHTDGVR